jgi:hypothetical protein
VNRPGRSIVTTPQRRAELIHEVVPQAACDDRMMVAMGIIGVVMAGVMQTFVVQNRAYSVVEDDRGAANLRAISYLLERDLRATSFMLPEGTAACGIVAATRQIFVTDSADQPGRPVSAGLYATIVGLRSR